MNIYKKSRKKGKIKINQDFYWDISKEEKYNPYSKPKELTMGQLEDDWNEIMLILEEKREPITYSLVWISSLLRVVGEEIVE